MKKFICFLLCAVLIVCGTLALVGCDKEESLPDIADCEIGYEMPMYPACEFDYQVNSECIVHVKDIKMTLIEKNTISDNQLVEKPFQPYVFELTANGKTDPKFAGKTLYLALRRSQYCVTLFSYGAIVEEDGSIHWCEKQYGLCSTMNLFFCYITI